MANEDVFPILLVVVGSVAAGASLFLPNVITTLSNYINQLTGNSSFQMGSELLQEARDLATAGIRQYVLEMQDLEGQVKQAQVITKAQADQGLLANNENTPKEADFERALDLIRNSIITATEAHQYAETIYKKRMNRKDAIVKNEPDEARKIQLEYEETALLVQDLRNIEESQSKLLERILVTLKESFIKVTRRMGAAYAGASALGLTSSGGEGAPDTDKATLQKPVSFEEAVTKIQTMRQNLSKLMDPLNAKYNQVNRVYTMYSTPSVTKDKAIVPTLVDQNFVSMFKNEFQDDYTLLTTSRNTIASINSRLIEAEKIFRLGQVGGKKFNDVLPTWTTAKDNYLNGTVEIQSMTAQVEALAGRFRTFEQSGRIANPDMVAKFNKLFADLAGLLDKKDK